jgi:hypothetical protein
VSKFLKFVSEFEISSISIQIYSGSQSLQGLDLIAFVFDPPKIKYYIS